jgi:hypothetical protein
MPWLSVRIHSPVALVVVVPTAANTSLRPSGET